MFCVILVLYFGVMLTSSLVEVNGYARDCEFNQMMFVPERTTATFIVNVTHNYNISKLDVPLLKRLWLNIFFRASLFNEPGVFYPANIYISEQTMDTRIHINVESLSSNIVNVMIDLNNVSMNDNGTFMLVYNQSRDKACFVLFVMEIHTDPSYIQEENEQVLVYAHPAASLIKPHLTNPTMIWLFDGKPVNQMASFLEQDGRIWIPNVKREFNGKNVTYRALYDDGRIVEVNVTLKVTHGPIHPLKLVPRKPHYNLVSGEILPDITCTSDCYPPCNISWGMYSAGNTLALGAVTTKDRGEYTCTATGLNGRSVEQTISVDVTDKAVSECNFNQTMFVPEGTTATFMANITTHKYDGISLYAQMIETLGLIYRYNVLYARLFYDPPSNNGSVMIRKVFFGDQTFETRIHINVEAISGDTCNVIIDLNNVSMNDNRTYTLRYYKYSACFVLFVMEIHTDPSNIQEENEPVFVYAHPAASLIKLPLTNATMIWLFDGKRVNQMATFLEQDGHIWIPNVKREFNGKNVTYRALYDDGRIVEVNVTLKVTYGPSHPLKLVPRKPHYNLVSGEILPDITCTSDCYPPCNISWGMYSAGNTLALGAVTTKDRGEYTCTATGLNGRSVEQTISVDVTDKAVSECDFNQTMFVPEGTTATFMANITTHKYDGISLYAQMIETLGLIYRYNVLYARLFYDPPSNNGSVMIRKVFFGDQTFETRIHINVEALSGDTCNVIIDLNNVSMNDNRTYTLRYYKYSACFVLFVMEIHTDPSNIQEENEPVLVYAHPAAPLIKPPLTNVTMIWLFDGKPVNQMATFLEQDGRIWIPNVKREFNGKNVTYRALYDDGKIVEVNVTIKVTYGPSHPLKLVPRKQHYNLVSGEILPDITCTSDCYPPCNISWGVYSTGNRLALGAVTSKHTGEYTCTATGLNDRSVEQTISVEVTDKAVSDTSRPTTETVSFASVQVLTFFVLVMFAIAICKRKFPCCNQENVSQINFDTANVTSASSPVQQSELEYYEERRDETRNVSSTNGEI